MRKLVSILLLCTIVACSDDGPSNTPEITFVSITPDVATANQDVVTITISYTDGNGDLGENNADVKNLFVTDSRNDVTYSFRIPALAPEGSNVAITGNLPIELANLSIIDQEVNVESVTFSVQVTDQAGNESNIVDTTPITISR